MDTQVPSVLKVSPDQMVCSRQPWTSHTWPPFLIKTGNCPAELHCQTQQQMQPTQPTQETLQQNMLRSGTTSLLHSTPAKTSSSPILTGLRVLVDSLELITSILWWCQGNGTCTQKVSNCYVAPGVWEAREVHWPRYYCSSWRAYWLGLFTCLLMEGKWEHMSPSQPKGS